MPLKLDFKSSRETTGCCFEGLGLDEGLDARVLGTPVLGDFGFFWVRRFLGFWVLRFWDFGFWGTSVLGFWVLRFGILGFWVRGFKDFGFLGTSVLGFWVSAFGCALLSSVSVFFPRRLNLITS